MNTSNEWYSRTVHRLTPFWRGGRPDETTPASFGDIDMTNVFAVVGEHRDDPNHLLVLGEDGQYYDYAVSTGYTTVIDLDRTWTTDRDDRDLVWAFGE